MQSFFIRRCRRFFFWGGLDVFSAEPADRQVLFVVARGFFYPQITQINADFFWGGLFFIRRFHRLTPIGAGFFGGMSCRCASSHAAGRKARKRGRAFCASWLATRVFFSHAKARRREEEGKEDFFSREGAKARRRQGKWRHVLPLRVKPRRRQGCLFFVDFEF